MSSLPESYASNDCAHAWLLGLLGRLVYSHRLDPGLVASALHVATGDVVALAEGRQVTLGPSPRLPLVVNILVRVELKLRGDSRAIRRALLAPLDTLGGRCPAEAMTGSLDDLRRVRLAIDHLSAPTERWWRVGHR